jgi:hypothetical protein
MTMLKEAKKALRVTAGAYDTEIASLLEAGARDLEIAGVILPGNVSFTVDGDTVVDTSDLTDPLVMRAIFTYAAMRFGNPPNYDRLSEAYEIQKGQLMHATGYTDYGEEDEEDPSPAAQDDTEGAEDGTGGAEDGTGADGGDADPGEDGEGA